MTNPDKPAALHLLTVADKTRQQLHSLLDIVATLRNTLPSELSDIPQGGALDGGVRAAIEATMLNACSRIDALLNDGPRWDCDPAQSADKVSADLATAELARAECLQRLAATESESAKQRQRPCFLLRPVLMEKDGQWLAISGDLVGKGRTPHEAMTDFDLAYALDEAKPGNTDNKTPAKKAKKGTR